MQSGLITDQICKNVLKHQKDEISIFKWVDILNKRTIKSFLR